MSSTRGKERKKYYGEMEITGKNADDSQHPIQRREPWMCRYDDKKDMDTQKRTHKIHMNRKAETKKEYGREGG